MLNSLKGEFIENIFSNTFLIFRDLGEHLRVFINRAYKENKFEEHPKYWDRQYLCIKRLLDNEHKNKYKRSLSSTATGLTKEECHTILSTEVLEELEKEEKSYFRNIFVWIPGRKEK